MKNAPELTFVAMEITGTQSQTTVEMLASLLSILSEQGQA
jgi:hypothetical protein